MTTGTITVASLRGLEGWLWDDRVIGLGARKQTKGVFFYLRYRFQGRQIIKSIGRLDARGRWSYLAHWWAGMIHLRSHLRLKALALK